MKVLKIVFSILALLVFVCILAIGSLFFFADPDKLKPAIIEQVKNETGYLLTIEGKLSWSFYPRMGVRVDRMTLRVPDETQAFIDARDVRMATDLVEILHAKEKLQGNILIANIRLVNIHAENVSATLHWKNNVLTLDPISASLYEGTLEGIAIGRDFAATPHWQWDMQGKNIRVKSLLQDVNGNDSKVKISGTGALRLQAETSGKSRDQIMRQVNGTSEFSLNHGAVEGIDINYFLQTANALLNKEAATQPVNSSQTEFNQLTGSAVIKNGVANTNNMLLIAPAFTSKAEGSIELVTRALDFKIQVKPQLENATIHWEVPILLTGDLKHPDVQLDRLAIQGMLAGIEIEKIKQKAVNEIKKHVHGKAGEFLQKLLGD